MMIVSKTDRLRNEEECGCENSHKCRNAYRDNNRKVSNYPKQVEKKGLQEYYHNFCRRVTWYYLKKKKKRRKKIWAMKT